MNRKSKFSLFILILAIILYIFFIGYKEFYQLKINKYSIAIISIVEIEPIAELRRGFRQQFESSNFAKNHNVQFIEFNAQGDSSLINQIADKMVVDRPDLIYVLGTPVSQAIQKRAPDLLILQGAATDPVSAGLADSWEGSGKNYIATSDLPPVGKQLSLIHDLAPKVTKIGLIYNPSEINSVAVISRLRDYIIKNNLDYKLIDRPIANSSDVATALQSMLGHVDAIYLPPDNTAYAAIPLIGRFATKNKLPFFASVDTALVDGAVATLSLDFVQLGRESADLALAVLNGENPTTMPIRVNENPRISISKKAAETLGLDIKKYQNRPNVSIVD